METSLPTNYTSVRFEVAQGAIGILLGHVTEQLAQEESKSVPSSERLTYLTKEFESLLKVRDELPAQDASAIEAVIDKYSPRAKAISDATTPARS